MSREHNNLHLGDALNHLEKALSANQGKREENLREVIEIAQFVLKEERDSERSAH